MAQDHLKTNLDGTEIALIGLRAVFWTSDPGPLGLLQNLLTVATLVLIRLLGKEGYDGPL